MSTTSEDRNLAMLAHLLSLAGYLSVGVACWVPPLIIYLVKRDNRFVAYHALQALFFSVAVPLTAVALTLLFVAVGFFTCGLGWFALIPVLLLVVPYHIIVVILTGMKAGHGGMDRYPIVGEWARGIVYASDVTIER